MILPCLSDTSYNCFTMRIMVAMSGGVDSSVIAHMLKEQGHDIVGVRFMIWTDPKAPAIAQILPSKCCEPQTVARAIAVAKTLDIPFHHIDIQNDFKREVVDTFLDDYQHGRTPNPCVICNRTIKFGKMFEIADELGCEKIATGHYARIKEEEVNNKTIYHLIEAKDKNKDQSYFLYTLTQEKLSRTLFPLGDMLKKDVIKMAKKYKIPLPTKYQESQDVCFYPEKAPEEFLSRNLKHKPGDICTLDGKVVGKHKGIPFYTIGQRKGLNIGGLKIPLHVVEKNATTNTLFVASSGADCELELSANSLNWITESPEKNTPIESLEARICSNGKRRVGTLFLKGDSLTFTFNEPARGIAPGQSIVLYEKYEIVGGGVICQQKEK